MRLITLLGTLLAGTAFCGDHRAKETTKESIEHGKRPASTADCTELSLALLYYPLGPSFEYVESMPKHMGFRRSCHLFLAADACDDNGDCSDKYRAKVSNADVAMLVGGAANDFGKSGKFTAEGTMKCVTDVHEGEPRLKTSTGRYGTSFPRCFSGLSPHAYSQ
ncbi:hypothetical protein PG996_010030 [Apiospora saccharicola]|uniref:Ecp2 effector protein domain-containing protein n=1 Tax=Apiospora saccharicola TaxID=335842 RepID=A0ABR1UMF2_9PEZI